MKTKILSLGNAYFQIDSIAYPLPNPIPLGKELVGKKYIVSAASSALIFARVCASLEMEPYFIGKIGDDILGKEAVRMVKEGGVIFEPIISDNHQTNISINYVNDKGESVMFVSGNANQSLTSAEITEKMDIFLKKVEFLYLGGVFKLTSLLPTISEIIKNAHDNNVKVILDHNRITNLTNDEDKELMKKIVAEVDFYFPSNDEALELWGATSIDEALEKISKATKAKIVIKNSKEGAVGLENEKVIRSDAFSVEIMNTVGAGDSYNAGIIRAQIDGLSFENSLKFANATAAIKISRKELPTLEEIKKLCHMN